MASDTYKAYLTYNSFSRIKLYGAELYFSVSSSRLRLEQLERLNNEDVIYPVCLIFRIKMLQILMMKIQNTELEQLQASTT